MLQTRQGAQGADIVRHLCAVDVEVLQAREDVQAADFARHLRAAEVEMLQTRKGVQFAGIARHLRVVEVGAGLRLLWRGGPSSSATSQGATAPDGANRRRGAAVAAVPRSGEQLLLPWAPTAAVGWARAWLASTAWLAASWLLLLKRQAGPQLLQPPFNSRVMASAAAGSSAATSAAD